jgi:hypothetical protein
VNREAYDAFVELSPQGSVFCSSWWLDAVAGGAWRPNVLEDAEGIAAAWPTVVRKTPFGNLHAGAPLTPFLGPLFSPDQGKSETRRRSTEIKRLQSLLGLIEPAAHIEARCNPAFDYWTPLSWHGFKQSTRYTWRLPDLGDLDAVLGGLHENTRYEIRKARKRGVTVEIGPLEEFEAVHAATAARGGLSEYVRRNREALRRIEAAAARRQARTILLARDGDGGVHAGGYFVHDARYVYYLAGGSDPAHRTDGSPTLLLWRAIELAAERGVGFDFEGSMVRGVERFFRSFGGVPAPYSVVRKTASTAMRLTVALKRAARSAG